MRISDWSSDVCSSDLGVGVVPIGLRAGVKAALRCVRSVAVMSVTVQEGHTSSREAALRSELDEALARVDSFLDGYCERPSVQWLDRDALSRITASVAGDRALVGDLRERVHCQAAHADPTPPAAQVPALPPRNSTHPAR